MRRIKAKRIIKHSNSTESYVEDDLLVKWAIKCVGLDHHMGHFNATNSSNDDLTTKRAVLESLYRDICTT